MAATVVFYVVKYNINSRRKAVPNRREAGAALGEYGTFAIALTDVLMVDYDRF